MAEKNAVVRGLIGGILYDLMVKTNVYQIKVSENTTLADKLQEIVTALNGKITAAQLEAAVKQAMEEAKDSGELEDMVVSTVEKYLEENPVESGGSAEGAVLYNEAQSLTEDQKAQARANIGSISEAELEGAKPFFVPVEMGEDGESVATEVPFADIVTAYASQRLVYALVGGIFQLPLVSIEEDLAIFLLNAGAGTVAVTLYADGTGIYQVMEASGGGGAEPLIVEINMDDDGNMTSDVSYDEITEAAQSGRNVYAVVDSMVLPLTGIADAYVQFELTMPQFGVVIITVGTDGSVEQTQAPFGGGSLIVTVTADGSNLVSDVPFEEIVNAYITGRQVYALLDSFNLSLVAITGSTVLFSATYAFGDVRQLVSLSIREDGSAEPSQSFLTSKDELDECVTVAGLPMAMKDAQYPFYVRTEAEAVEKIVNRHQSNDSIVFPFLADAHCGYYNDIDEQATTLAGKLLDLIGKRVPFDFVVNGGDMSSGAWNTYKDDAFDDHADYTELTVDGQRGVPSLWVPGNHDDAPYLATANRLSQKDVFALVGRKNRLSGAVVPDGCNYCYLDLQNRKLRIICLDTDDKRSLGTVKVGNGETAPAYLNAHNVGGSQLQWLAGEALDFSHKENPADWSIVVVSHVALNVTGSITDAVSGETYEHSTKNAAIILAAYKNGRSGSITHNGITASYDFSSAQNRAVITCAVHGHNHNFSSETLEGGIVSIGCPNVMNGRERVSDDGNTYTKTEGTANGTSFCILTIDRENQKIYADCVGAGYDREFVYTTGAIPYTNQLPISTDANGNVFNGKGYKENTYLSYGNEGDRTGIYTTGFIPCKLGDTLYFENAGLQEGQDGHRFCFYNADKSFTQAMIKTDNQNYAGFTFDDSGNLTAFTLKPSGENQNTAFIRFCSGYLGADSVVTVNETIT